MTLIFMFPGQSSRYPEMLDRIVGAWPSATEVVARAEETLGRDLRARYLDGACFESNRDVQVGVFLTSHLHLMALEAAGVRATASLGLSLGEYNHLVHIGALDFEAALRLVDARGRVYDEGPMGMMACIQPANEDELSPLLEQVRHRGHVSIANYNSPTQQVIAGELEAVEALMTLCEDELYVQPVVIEKRIPMHTEVFRPVADAFRPHLERAPWRQPMKPYLSNVTAELLSAPRPEQFVDCLSRHVHSPVRWRESIDLLTQRHPDAIFLEVGPRGVLFNLLQKRWHANRKYKSDSLDDLASHLGSLGGELGAVP